MIPDIALGLLFSSLIGLAGYYKGALSKSGALGALVVGTAIFGFGGWAAGLVLIAFFVSASALSFFKAEAKQKMAEKFDKGHRRDLGQALANGGAGAIIAVLGAIWSGDWWLFAFLGAMGTVNADTWATEFGVLSKQPPRLITTGKPVPSGTSGGITIAGSLAALGGAIFIGLAGWLLFGLQQLLGGASFHYYANPLFLIFLVGGAGFFGSLVDSWLGATLQAMYFCDRCNKETEQSVHRTCGNKPTRFLRGLKWLNNDLVNLISSAAGALAAAAMGVIIGQSLS